MDGQQEKQQEEGSHSRNAQRGQFVWTTAEMSAQSYEQTCLTGNVLLLPTGGYPATLFLKWEKFEESNHCQHGLCYPH